MRQELNVSFDGKIGLREQAVTPSTIQQQPRKENTNNLNVEGELSGGEEKPENDEAEDQIDEERLAREEAKKSELSRQRT